MHSAEADQKCAPAALCSIRAQLCLYVSCKALCETTLPPPTLLFKLHTRITLPVFFFYQAFFLHYCSDRVRRSGNVRTSTFTLKLP